MARSEIILGTPPLGLGGDPPRTASTKINAMTLELYLFLGGSGANPALPAALPVSKGGTGNTTGTATKLAAAAMVGTVSQVGAVPTGAIIERGSNANGHFTKYADGTMICWDAVGFSAGTTVGAGNIFQSPPVPARSFPASFAGAPKIFITASCALAVSVCVISGDANAPSWPPALCQGPYNTGSTFYQGIMNYMAIGRWY